MFDADGVRIRKSSSDIFTDYKILDLDRTPQGFGENTTDIPTPMIGFYQK